MPVTIMAKNYSHCPLKKRPVPVIDDSPDEPENLSTKPEDLSRTGRYPKSELSSPPVSPHFAPLPSPPTSPPASPIAPQPSPCTVSPASSPPISPASAPSPPHDAYQQPQPHIKTEPCLPYPAPISPEYAPQTWHRSVAPIYPPVYYPMTYGYHHHHQHDYLPLSSPSSMYSDNSCSPPHVQHHHQHQHQQPLQPLALRPTAIYPLDQSSLSPNSSTTTSPPPQTTSPEDLSEKRSRTSAGGVRHQCPDCGKSYSTFSGLSKHRQFHCAAGDGPRKSFSCKYCEKVYVSLGALKMHIRTHTLPCKCTICGKAFSRPWLLQGHIRTHTGEKPFSCTYCNRAFADRSNLRAHLQTHSDVKKYSCVSCSKTFSRMSLLTKHTEGGCASNSTMHVDKIY